MRLLRHFGLPLLLLGAPLLGQQVKFIDLTAAPQRAELRYPPPLPAHDGNYGEVGAIGSGADCGIDARDPRALTVYLENVIAENSDSKKPFEVEFKIMNTGEVPLQLPISPNLADLQPNDASAKFTYLSLALSVSVTENQNSEGYVEIYGKTDVPSTMITLNPGEWLRVEAKPKFHEVPPPAGDIDLKPRHSLQRVTVYPHPGGDSIDVVNICMPEAQTISLHVHRD